MTSEQSQFCLHGIRGRENCIACEDITKVGRKLTWRVEWANGSTGTVVAPTHAIALERAQKICTKPVTSVVLQEEAA